MKKTLMTLAVAVSLLSSALICGPNAAEIKSGGSRVGQAASKATTDDSATKAAEAPRSDKINADEEAKNTLEESKKTVVARVNGAGIAMFELVRAMNRVAPKYVKEGEATSAETTRKIKREALDRLIFEELAVQEAIKQGINPAPEAIEKVVEQVKTNLESDSAYKDYLEKSFLTEETLKKLIERSQRFELITAREVYGKVKVDDRLLQEEYEKMKEEYMLPENFVVEDVWFLKGKDEASRKKADEVFKNLNKNSDFKGLLLDGTFIVRKIAVKEAKYPEIHKSVAGMRVGDLSGVIEEKDGFHIIKVVKKDPARQATFEEARPTIEPKFLVAAQEQRRQEWEDELRKNAKIEIFEDKLP